MLTLSPLANQGDISVDCHDWNFTFSKDSNIYIGFGAVVLKSISVGAKEVKAQVVQGGTLRVGMNVFGAHTYKEPTVFDLTGVDITPFKNLSVDFVVIPGISTARTILPRSLGTPRKRRPRPRTECRARNIKIFPRGAEGCTPGR